MKHAFVFLVASVSLSVAGPDFPIGRLDTIGWTTYDWQNAGPAVRTLCNAPRYGLYAAWTSSSDTGTGFPDRNMRYSFRDYQVNAWDSAINVFTYQAGLGNLACDPDSQLPLISAHAGNPLGLVVARDMAPGAGIFEYCRGADGFIWPVIDAAQGQRIHAALIDDATRDGLWYSRCTTWCQWTPPVHISAGNDPMFPSHNITASKASRKVCLAWVQVSTEPYPGNYIVSDDGGTTWGPVLETGIPDAFGGDTMESFHLGMFLFYDRRDRLHIVAEVMPIVHDTGYINPIEIWHWSPENTPRWSEVHRAGCAPEHLMAAVGYNAVYAGRPSLAEDRNGGLYVAWEQFDSMNVEPGPPERLRADIWYARDNYDNGMSWLPGIQITDPDQTSKRFPCAVDMLARDTLCIIYMVDLIAGFAVQSEGPATNNPVIVQFVPVTVSGIRSDPELRAGGPAFAIVPNPARGQARLQLNQPLSGPAEVRVFDFAGRLVFSTGPLDHSTTGALPLDLSSGVYLIRMTTTLGYTSAKLVVR